MIIEADAPEGADLPAPRGRFLVGPRFAPGPLRTVRRVGPSGAAKGAVVGGLVGLAVLAALSLPLVLALVGPGAAQRQAEAPRPMPARGTAIPARPSAPLAAQGAPAEPAPIQAAYEPPPVPAAAPAQARTRSALSIDSLPTLTQDASEIDLDPVAADASPVPRQPQRVAAQRRTAQPKPAQP
ncbi:hypothetical protein [Methylobacterium sp. sgz302541]|uniref:hypothetical protein n=1 Tax=unclassified Methylobacterium TaxID=2615210 RepID=UPI003D337E37